MALSEYAKQQLFRQNIQAKFPYLIAIHNKDLGDFYFANSDDDIVYDNHTFTPAFFKIVLPEKSESSIGAAKLSISCVDQEWIVRIRSTQKRSTVRFIAAIQYEKDSVSTIEAIEDNTFLLTDASWDGITIEWTMIFDDNMSLLVPSDIASSQNCPGVA